MLILQKVISYKIGSSRLLYVFVIVSFSFEISLSFTFAILSLKLKCQLLNNGIITFVNVAEGVD